MPRFLAFFKVVEELLTAFDMTATTLSLAPCTLNPAIFAESASPAREKYDLSPEKAITSPI
jgi:hypothetical protein